MVANIKKYIIINEINLVILKKKLAMKYRIGLDIGIGSVGHTLLKIDGERKVILSMGSRIIPMGSDKSDYEKGVAISKNATRTTQKGIRKSNKRYKQRRNKLIYVLYKLGMLPEQIQFKNGIPEANKIQKLDLLPIKKGTMQLNSLSNLELRVNAISNPLDNVKDFGKILYRFNQLRGYSGGGLNDEENQTKGNENDEEENNKRYIVEVLKTEIVEVKKTDATFKYKNQDLPWYTIVAVIDEEEIIGKTKLQDLAIGEKELEVRIKTDKKGNKSYEFALPRKTNWRKQMEATEELLKTKKVFISELVLEDLKNTNKWTKIRNRVVLRNRYKEEFDKIWETQAKKFDVLNNCPKNLLEEIVNYIFPGQSESQVKLKNEALDKGLRHLIKEQIIYYQRPLKPQTDLIRNCQFEEIEKVIANSHPLFQEFRCWDQINRLFITSKRLVFNERKGKDLYQYENRFLNNEEKLEIYLKLQNQKQVGFSDVAKIVGLKNDKSEFLNGLNVKAKLKGFDTIISIKKIFQSFEINLDEISINFYDDVWNSLYNVSGNEYDVNSEKIKSLQKILENYGIENPETISLKLAQTIKFPRKYSNLSLKAIREILPLMQLNPQNISEKVKVKFQNILHLLETGEIFNDEIYEDYILDFVKNNNDALQKGGLMYAFASSLVYGKHTAKEVSKEIKDYHQIKYVQRNLRNPVVEQMLNEVMQVVKSLWKKFKINPEELEFRVELARDLKNSAGQREKIYKAQIKNKQINDKIKERLIELKQEITPGNIDLYKLWSNQSIIEYPKISKEPTLEEIEKLRLWEEQGCISPYSGNPIPLSKLFSTERLYDIDHIIPKSRYFDDSLSNKVVCETNINEEKGNRTAWEYISAQNSKYQIVALENYITNVNDNYFGKKKKNLLLEKIPNNLIDRNLKDTQYISVAIKNELAKIVGSENVKTSTGEITAFLRGKWGLRKLFMKLTEERFKRMELWDWDEETKQPKQEWINKYFDKEKDKNIYEIKNWSKRYDHRHHAIDALVVALTEQSFIQRLNNLNKELQNWLSINKDKIHLEVKEGETELEAFFNLKENERDEIQKQIEGFRYSEKPITDLIEQARKHLETMIVSHKKKDKLAVKSIEEKGKLKKQLKIRSALHEATYYGKTLGVDTKTVDISALSAKDIPKIVDQDVLAKEIDAHRKKYDSMKEAFSGEGLIAFNESRFQTKNSDKLKPPVYKVKIRYNSKENVESNLQRLYDDNDKKSVVTGDNYLFLVMEKQGKKGISRTFDIASLYDSVIIAKDALKNNKENFKEIIAEDFRIKNKEKPQKVLFTLQQNDLVYMPTDADDPVLKFNQSEFDQWYNDISNKKLFSKQVYKVVKFTGKDCFFIPHNFATPINVPKILSENDKIKLKEVYKDKKIPKTELNFQEFSSFGNCTKVEVGENFIKNIKGIEKIPERKIQDYCIKINIDWLGSVKLERI